MDRFDIPALRSSLAQFIKDPRTIKAFEGLGNTAVDAQDAATQAIGYAQAAQDTAVLAMALIDLLSQASYVTLAPNSTLDNERTLTAGNLIGITDAGPGAALTLKVNSTTVGGNLVALTNPSAVTFPRINADNTVSALTAAQMTAALGNVAWAPWTPTISSDGGAFGSILLDASECRWQTFNNTVIAHASFQIVTVGTASGAILVSLPATPARGIMVTGNDVTLGRMMFGNKSGTNARISRYDGVTPIVASDFYYVTMIYQIP